METAATRHANKIDVKRHSKGPQSYAYFLVLRTTNVPRKAYPSQDGLHAADIAFTGIEVGSDAAMVLPRTRCH